MADAPTLGHPGTIIAPGLSRRPYLPTRTRSIAIVALGGLLLFLNNGFILVGLSSFDLLMLHRLGVSVGVLKVRDSITFFTVALSSPLAGYLLDRFGPRPLMMLGMTLMAVGMAAYTVASTIDTIYWIHFGFGIALVLAGLFANMVLVSLVTDRHRGLAVGSVLAAASLGKALAPKIDSLLQTQFGWQPAFLVVAVASVAVIPLIAILVPALGSQGRNRDGDAHGGIGIGAALRTRTFWMLALIAAIGFFSEIGVAANMVLFVVKQRHLGRETANIVLFVLFVAVLITQIVMGALADRLGSRWLQAGALLLMALGTFAMTSAAPMALWIGALCFGLGWGGTYALIQFLVTRLFAGSALGRILGLIGFIEAVGAGAGPGVVGLLYDRSASFVPAFTLVSLLLVVAAFAALFAVPVRGAVLHTVEAEEVP